MRFILNCVFLFVAHISFSQQSEYYLYTPEYRDGENFIKKTYVELYSKYVTVQFDASTPLARKEQIISEYKLSTELPLVDRSTANLIFEQKGNFSIGEVEILVANLNAESGVSFAAPFFKVNATSDPQTATNTIILKPKPEMGYASLESIVDREGLSNLRLFRGGDTYLAELLNTVDCKGVFNVCADLYESEKFEYVEPNIITLAQYSCGDPLYDNQWSLNNNFNNTGQYGGVLGEDIEMEYAWTISDGGSPATRIAVMDLGIELNHPDLPVILPGQNGYDFTNYSNTGGSPLSGESHGTNCAGIISAQKDNSIGLAGIAYKCQLFSYKNGYLSGGVAILDNLVNTACLDQAISDHIDVVNMSFGINGGNSSIFNDAIYDAVNTANGGLGIVLVASSGNYSSSNPSTSIQYPASHPNVIAVGASTMCAERKSYSSCDGDSSWGSCHGGELDVVAPGVKMKTTDLSGGYTSFGGTSASAPVVAAIAALIRSEEPSLTQEQVRTIIEATCEKIGGYSYAYTSGRTNGTWNQEMGYGRVNARAALEMATGSSAHQLTPCNVAVSCIIAQAGVPSLIQYDTYHYFEGVGFPNTIDAPCIWAPSAGANYLRYTLYDLTTSTQAIPPTIVQPNLPGNWYTLNGNTNGFNFQLGHQYKLVVEAWDQDRLNVNGATLNPSVKDSYYDYDATEKIFTAVDCSNFSVSTATSTPFVCYDDTSATIDLSSVVSGGVTPYTYQWSNNNFYGQFVDGTPSPSLTNEDFEAGVNTFTLKVIDAQGCIVEDQIQVDAKHIDINSPDKVKICVGSSEVIDISVTGDGPLDYSWSPTQNTYDPNVEDVQIQAIANTTTVYTVTVIDVNGCSNTALTSVKGTGPTFATVSAGADQTICTGGDVTISGSYSNGTGVAPFVTEWYDGSISLGNSPSLDLNPMVTTTYTYAVTDDNNCTSVDELIVTVDATLDPILDFGTDITICPGPPVTVPQNASLTNVTHPVDVYINGSSNPVPITATYTTVDNMNSETVSVQIIDANGCSATDDLEIIRDPGLGPQTILTWDNENTICPGEDATVSTVVSGGSAPYDYLWSSNGGSAPTGYFPNGGNKPLTVTDANGCINEVDIDVIVPAPWEIYYLSPLLSLCVGDELTLEYFAYGTNYDGVIRGGTEPYQAYHWYPETGLSDPNVPSPTATIFGSTFYSLQLTDAHGCVSPDDFSDIGIYKVMVSEDVASASMTYESSPDCESGLVCFEANPAATQMQLDLSGNPFTNFGGYDNHPYWDVWNSPQYEWNFGSNASPQTSTLENPCVDFGSSGFQNVSLTITNACGSNTYTETIYVVDYDFSTVPYNDYICGTVPQFQFIQPFGFSMQYVFPASNTIHAGNNCSNTVIANSYAEYVAGNEIHLHPGFEATNTKFTAKIIPCVFENGLRLAGEEPNEPLKEVNIEVYPNPTKGVFTLEILGEYRSVNVEIVDIMGKVILIGKGASETTFNLKDNPSGMYFVRAEIDGKAYTKKIVKD